MGVELSKLSRFDMLDSWDYYGEACSRMEECSDGDFVRYDDVVDLIDCMKQNVNPIGYITVEHVKGCTSMQNVDYEHSGLVISTGRYPVYATPQPVVDEMIGATEWIKRIRDSTDKLLAEAGFQPDCSIRHGLAMMNFEEAPLPVVPEGSDAFLADVQAAIKTGDLVKADMLIQGFRVALLSVCKGDN
jgi:hypothetical protein